MTRAISALLFLALLTTACGGSGDSEGVCGSDCTPKGTMLVIDVGADFADSAHFFDMPYPSDLRRDADGHPMLSGFPNPKLNPVVDGFLQTAEQSSGFAVLPVVHMRFTGPLAERLPSDVVAADPASPILLLDIDEKSPDRGQMLPVVAETLASDIYTPENVLAIAPRPGFVLRADTSYAALVLRGAKDADGADLVQNPVLTRLARRAPKGDAEKKADGVYAPLWDTLDTLGVDLANVAGATVFTTDDVVREQFELSEKIVSKYDLTVDGIAEYQDPGVTDICVLSGSIDLPQFQVGKPPFSKDGLFDFGPDGLPVEQRKETSPVKIVLPKAPMPAAGYPLVLNIHGSGGYSIAMVRPLVGDETEPGDPIGPAFPLAERGFAMAGMAMPVNPERLPGASETEYLNANNLAAMRDTFRQGQIELRLFIEALSKLEIDPAALGACTGPTLPAGATHFKFDASNILVTGQSMGGMYTNIIAATEPMLRAAIPTGAGGHWTHFIFVTPLNGGAYPGLFKVVLGIPGKPLDFLHPFAAVAAQELEASDPMVYAPRVARRPLDGHAPRPIYEPCAPDDHYFPTVTYDAMALAYGHREAGTAQWSTMQDALALEQLDGLLPFPVENDVASQDGTPYTGVVVQWEPKALPGMPPDAHAVSIIRDDVKYQYSCFASSFVQTGKATVPPPVDDWHAACP
jgi:hypothetical protein